MADITELPDVEGNAQAPTFSQASPGAPYAPRAITVTFQLGQGDFGGSGFNTVTIEGMRCVVQIETVASSPGNIVTPNAVIQVYGMTLDQMNSISKAGLVWDSRQNLVAVQAGDKNGSMVTVFNGLIQEAYPDGSDPPTVPFVVIANAGAQIQLKPTKSISFNGGVSIDTVLNQIIQPAGLTLENNGVMATLNNPYFPGTVMQQIQSAVRAADCFSYIDPIRKVLSIWPKNKSRNSNGTQTIGPNSGMIGYPAFEQNLVKVRTLFDPALHSPGNVGPGTKIKIQSQFTAASGMFSIISDSYNLSSELPGGPWERMITATPTM